MLQCVLEFGIRCGGAEIGCPYLSVGGLPKILGSWQGKADICAGYRRWKVEGNGDQRLQDVNAVTEALERLNVDPVAPGLLLQRDLFPESEKSLGGAEKLQSSRSVPIGYEDGRELPRQMSPAQPQDH